MTRRLVFAGGMQAKAMAKAYRLEAAGEGDDVAIFFVGLDSMTRDAAHRVIAAADVIVTEVTPAGEAVPESLRPARATVVEVPVVRGDFLWPFAGKPHPRNLGVDALPDGPYPADFGDSHLDRLLAEGIPEDEAVRRYLEFDVASIVDLDGLLRRVLDDQATLDLRTGLNVADIVGRGFRAGDLFATRERLALPLFRQIAGSVFDRIGADPARAESLSDAHFPPGEMPIHPGVLRHFGMQNPAPDHAYLILDEGAFTFEQYCRRYVRYAWNAPLHAAIALAEINPSEAVPALRHALRDSPSSPAGRRALEQAERVVLDNSRVPAPAGPARPSATRRHFDPQVGGGRGADASGDEVIGAVLEPQRYVELPLSYIGHGAPGQPGRDRPLAPADELIEVLPHMLPSTRTEAGSAESPFAVMPETMPPPPLRPVLPPEQQPAPVRRGLMARLFGGGR